MDLILKLNKRSSTLLLNKLLMLPLYKIQEQKRLKALAWTLVQCGEYEIADYVKFLRANNIELF